MSASDAVSVSKPSSAADTARSSTFVLIALRVNSGRVRVSPAEFSTSQPAAFSALPSAIEFANVPTVIVFHTGTAAADLTKIGDTLAEEVFLSIEWFRRTSRGAH